MRNLITIGATVAGLAFALPASAQVVGAKSSATGNYLTLTNAGLFSGSTLVASLNGGSVYTNDMPFADIPKGDISMFLAAGPTSGSSATLTFTNPISYLSFLWGSPDTYNVFNVTYTNTAGTTTATQQFTAAGLGFTTTNGNQNVSQYVSFSALPGSLISAVNFTNNPNIDAFEAANFSVTSPVPEPAAWAMMLVGVGFMGAALRRSRKVSTRVTYA